MANGSEGQKPGTEEPDGRLIGWKAIAGYLGRDIRTVQRWEVTEGLPVRRLEHHRQGSAYAFRSELDEWQRRRSSEPASAHPAAAVPSTRSGSWIWIAGGVAVIALVTAGLWTMWGGGAGARSAGGDTANAEAYAAFAEGKALYGARQYREAIAALEKAVARDQKYGSAWALLAKAHARLAQPVWAGGKDATTHSAEAARHAVQLAPNSADTRIALAIAGRARGDVRAWREEAQKAIDLDPRAAEAYALLGDSYSSVVYACSRDQDPERADAYYRKALELAPDLTTAISNRAGNLRRMGRYAECVELLNNAVRSFRDDTPLRATRGACRLMQGDLAGAAEDIDSLRGNPRIAPAGSLLYFGLLDLKRGRTDEGIRELEAAAAAGGSAQSHLIVAEVYGICGDISRAAAHMKQAFASDRACVATVDKSLAFRNVRNAAEVKQLLAEHGVR